MRFSRACEREQGSDIVRIGRAQRVNVTLTKVTGAYQIRATPSKDGPGLSLGEHVRYESRMATVPFAKGWMETRR
jgi:hypothetical protein